MQCPVCSEPMVGRLRCPRLLSCGHYVCAPCLLGMEWPCPRCHQQQAGVQLPDEVWLQVFALLDARTLLVTVRPTCRRWSALALDPSLWRRRALGDSTPLPLLLAVCRAAPCVMRLAVRLSRFNASALTQLASTSCAASLLILHWIPLLDSFKWISEILQNQVARGQILSLRLYVTIRRRSNIRAHMQVLLLLACTKQLPRITLHFSEEVDNEGPALSEILPDRRRKVPVANLFYTRATPAPLLRWLLAASAPSLEWLMLWNPSEFHSAAPLAELAECRQVHTAWLPAAAIQAIPPGSWTKLKMLFLVWYAPAASETMRQASIEFMRSAVQLESLTFVRHTGSAVAAGEIAVHSVAALASQTERAPSLRALTLELTFKIDSWNVLAGALPGLPALCRLELRHIPPPCFTEAISPRSAPRLALLLLQTCKPDLLTSRACAHLHELVLRYPAVHVLVKHPQRCGSGITFTYTALCGHLELQECDRSALDKKCVDYTLVRAATRNAATT